MPLYDYECPSCQTRKPDVRHVWDARPRIECPQCQKRMDRLMPGPALHTDTRWLGGRDPRTVRGSGVHISQVGRTVHSRGELRRICEREGHGCPELGVKYREPEDDPRATPYQPAADVVNEAVRERIDLEHGGVVPDTKTLERLRGEETETAAGVLGKRKRKPKLA